MKKLLIIAVYAMLLVMFTSCEQPGNTSKIINGDEQNLPGELKGLKIYTVATEGGGYVNVAVLNGTVNSTTYQVGKSQESTIILNKQNGKLISVSQILIENDSLIVCRK